MTRGHHNLDPAHEQETTPPIPRLDLSRPALDGHALSEEARRQTGEAVRLNNEEVARVQHIEAQIEAQRTLVAQMDAELAELIPKADINGVILRRFPTKKIIDVGQMQRRREFEFGKIDDLEEQKINPHAGHHGHDHEDPADEALKNEPGFTTLMEKVREAEQDVAARRQVMAIANGSQPASEAARAQARALVSQWGNDFDINIYRHNLLDTIARNHEKRVAKNTLEKEKTLFDQTESLVLERVNIAREFNRTKDPQLFVKINSWHMTIDRYRSQLLGFNPRSIERFRVRTIERANAAFEAAKKDPGSVDKTLADQIAVENQINAATNNLNRLKAQPESDEQKKAIKQAEAELTRLLEKKKKWKTQTNELLVKVMDREREKHAALIETAG